MIQFEGLIPFRSLIPNSVVVVFLLFLSTISTRWSLEGMSVNQRENFYLPESFPCEVNALANQIKVLDMEVEHVTMICQDYV